MAFQNSSHIDARGGIFYDVHGDQFTIGQIIRTHSDSPGVTRSCIYRLKLMVVLP